MILSDTTIFFTVFYWSDQVDLVKQLHALPQWTISWPTCYEPNMIPILPPTLWKHVFKPPVWNKEPTPQTTSYFCHFWAVDTSTMTFHDWKDIKTLSLSLGRPSASISLHRYRHVCNYAGIQPPGQYTWLQVLNCYSYALGAHKSSLHALCQSYYITVSVF